MFDVVAALPWLFALAGVPAAGALACVLLPDRRDARAVAIVTVATASLLALGLALTSSAPLDVLNAPLLLGIGLVGSASCVVLSTRPARQSGRASGEVDDRAPQAPPPGPQPSSGQRARGPGAGWSPAGVDRTTVSGREPSLPRWGEGE